jgi:hypothetical protein
MVVSPEVQHEFMIGDAEPVAIVQAAAFDLLSIDKSAVEAAKIFDQDLGVSHRYSAVLFRHIGRTHHHVAVRSPSDERGSANASPLTGVHRFQDQ